MAEVRPLLLHMADGAMVGATIAVITQAIPIVAGVLTIAWTAVRLAISWQEWQLNRRRLTGDGS